MRAAVRFAWLWDRRTSLAVLTGMVVSLMIGAAAADDLRTWSDATGKHKIKGSFVSEEDGVVTLRDEKGQEIEIALIKLSTKDRSFITELKKAGEDNPFQAKPKDSSPFKAATRKGAAPAGGKPAPAEEAPARSQGTVEVDLSAVDTLSLAPSGDWTWPQEPLGDPWDGLKPKTTALPGPPEANARFDAAIVQPAAKRAALCSFAEKKRAFGERSDGSGTCLVVLADLEKGKTGSVAKFEGESMLPLDLHPDGERLLMVRNVWGFGNHDRVEIWKATGKGTSLAAFEPYKALQGGERDIAWGAFHGEEQFVLKSGKGEISLWQLEPLEPLARFSVNWLCTPALSANGKYLAYATDKDAGVMDLEAREPVGNLSVPAGLQWSHVHLAFSPDAQRLAALSWSWLLVWDLKTGALERQIYVGREGANAKLLWTSNEHVLVGGENLIDVPNQLKVWQYKQAGARQQPVAAGGWTFLPVPPFGNRPGALLSLSLPHAGVADAVKKALADPNYFVLKPGTAVQINAQGLADAAEREKVVQALTAKLEANGCRVAADGPVSLVASQEPGKVEKLRFIALPGEYEFPSTITKLQISSGGTMLWEESWNNTPGGLFTQGNETIEQALQRHRAPNYGAFQTVGLPKYLPRPNPQGSSYLGASQITAAGLR